MIDTPKGNFFQHLIPSDCQSISGQASENFPLVLSLVSSSHLNGFMTKDTENSYQEDKLLQLVTLVLREPLWAALVWN